MKNLISIPIILLLIFPVCLFGQAPGYLGKRASIMFNFSSFPALFGPTQNNRGSEERTFGDRSGWLGINYELEGQFSYALGRYYSLGVFGGQYYTATKSKASTLSLPQIPGSNDMDSHELFHRLNVTSVGLVYSKFNKKKGALAPIGNRFFCSLKTSFIKSEIIDKKTTFYNSDGELFGHGNLNIDEKINFSFFHFGWSNSQVFWNKMIVNVGFKIGFPLNLKYYASLSDGGTDGSALDIYNTNRNQANYEAAVFDRLFRHELMRIDIGVGYLLF